MTHPIRIQRSRKYKQVSPNGLPIVYVGRPTKWGNPFKIEDMPNRTAEEAVCKFEQWVGQYTTVIKAELKGKNLSCWCALDCACHADILLKIANE